MFKRLKDKLQKHSRKLLSASFGAATVMSSLPAFAAESTDTITITTLFTYVEQTWTGLTAVITHWLSWMNSNPFVLIPCAIFLIGAAVSFVARLWRTF